VRGKSLKFDLWLFGICSSRVFTHLVVMTYAAALPVLQKEWEMSAATAGSISSGFQIGYAFSLLVFSALADRVGAKRVFLLSNVLTVFASLIFAAFARGYNSGVILYTLIGLCIGGVYTPGLMMLADRYSPRGRGMAIGFYIASTSLGYAISLSISGAALPWGGYRISFFLTCLGPLVGLLVAWATLASTPNKIFPRSREQRFSTEVLGNASAILFIGAYVLHCWELLGMWAWTPAFLSACLEARGSALWTAVRSGAYIVGLFHLTGIVASLSMGTLSDRLGRPLVILLVSSISTACSFVIGWLIGFPVGLIVFIGMIYAFSALGDSPILSAGITESIEPSYLGTAFAARGLLGFGAGAISPYVFGAVLDYMNPAFSDTVTYATWGWSFSALGLAGSGVVIMAYMLHRGRYHQKTMIS
jgi:MFS family permease